MASYESFAKVYDRFMNETPYDSWVNHMIELFQRHKIAPELILELGCGTGNITERMADKGYDMIGIDYSEEMLMIAKEKARVKERELLYLLQDMREFELYGTVGAVISLCDSMNYLLEEEDLLEVFKLVNNYLDPGGLFIFDLNTEYKYKTLLGSRTFAESREDSSYIWENYYYEDEKINEYELTLFVKEEEGLYRRFEEEHYQRAYSVEEIRELIEKAGLAYIEAYDSVSLQPPSENSERIYIVAKEKDKNIGGIQND